MNETTNYKLKKPAYTDMADVGISNSNLDILDALLFNLNKYKADTIVGKGLSEKDFTSLLKDKLDGIEEKANNYKHPASHSISIITETSTKKIMTELERIKLRDIEEGATNYQHPETHGIDIITETVNKKIMTKAERDKLEGVAVGANKYTHPSKHPPAIIDQDLNNRFISDLELAKIEDNKIDLDAHKIEKVHQGELHGLRLTDGKLEYFDGLEWQRIKGDGYPVGNISNFETKGDNNTVTLTWRDPPNVTVTDSLGNLITIARWKGTKILRKANSYPANESDGVLVVDNGIRDQYKTNGFTDTGLINDKDYYYMAFPYTEEDVFTVDVANRIIGTPSDVDDKTTAPGPKKLLAGDMQAGYFGVVPASELYTGAEISSACGMSQGTLQFSDVGWLKFAIDGKIIFKSQKTYRHSISWDHIDGVGAVKGTKQVTKGENTYKVRLMKGALTDPSLYDASDRGAKGSEWNRLMLPIHIKAKDKSWAYPDYVESTIPYWGIDFTDNDLQTISSAGDGSYQWCQETPNTNASNRVGRGYNGVSNSFYNTSSLTGATRGWSPVLEWVS